MATLSCMDCMELERDQSFSPVITFCERKSFNLAIASTLPIPKSRTIPPRLSRSAALSIWVCCSLKQCACGLMRMLLVCELEGHKGRDGRYYLIDLARLMPSEGPKTYDLSSQSLRMLPIYLFVYRSSNIFSHCLRGEFVLKCGTRPSSL